MDQIYPLLVKHWQLDPNQRINVWNKIIHICLTDMNNLCDAYSEGIITRCEFSIRIFQEIWVELNTNTTHIKNTFVHIEQLPKPPHDLFIEMVNAIDDQLATLDSFWMLTEKELSRIEIVNLLETMFPAVPIAVGDDVEIKEWHTSGIVFDIDKGQGEFHQTINVHYFPTNKVDSRADLAIARKMSFEWNMKIMVDAIPEAVTEHPDSPYWSLVIDRDRTSLVFDGYLDCEWDHPQKGNVVYEKEINLIDPVIDCDGYLMSSYRIRG